MKRTPPTISGPSLSRVAFLFGVVTLATLTGCVRYADGSQHGHYPPPPPVYVPATVVVHDDYVYYPGYQVYFSSSRNQYTYREGRTWVSRPAPPRVSVDVLLTAPSARMDFHDAPSLHHSRVVKQYPKRWKPPGHPSHGPGKDKRGKGNDRNDRL
jgi:hypothetical protein